MLTPGEDEARWKVDQAVDVEGYVAEVKPGGIESCNCHAVGLDVRDTHIDLTGDPMHDDPTRHVIVEVTPAWRRAMARRGLDWTTRGLRRDLLGRWVRVRGWLFFDSEHADEAENTAPGRERDWRGTAWEVHPVTSIQVLPARPAS